MAQCDNKKAGDESQVPNAQAGFGAARALPDRDRRGQPLCRATPRRRFAQCSSLVFFFRVIDRVFRNLDRHVLLRQDGLARQA